MTSTRNDCNQELKPGYQVTQPTMVKGRRTQHVSSVIKKEGVPSDEYTVTIPKLSKKDVIIPDTMMLTLNFKNSNDKSWFVNNLGRQMQKELKVSYKDTYIYENTDKATYGTYEDVWKSENERGQLGNTGIANEAIRKVRSGDNGAPTTGDDHTLPKNNDILAIKLGKVFEGHGPICPHSMADIKYLIRFPKSEEIMIAQSGEQKGAYKIENINLEFEAINGNVIFRPTSDGFEKGRHLYYSYIQSPNNQNWGKDETHKSITVSIPRKRLRGIVVLFREEGNEDSKHFANANIECQSKRGRRSKPSP